MDEITAKSQMSKIRGFEKGFMAVHLIKIGAELGVLEALNKAKSGLTATELASSLGLHEPYLKIWLQTAYHFEILDCDTGGQYVFQPFLNEILGDRSSFRNYLANITLITTMGELMKDVPANYRSGEKFDVFMELDGFSKIAYDTSRNLPLVFMFMIYPKNEILAQKMTEGVRFLDIGCGDGTLITQLATNFANSTFVGVSPDRFGIEMAERKIVDMQLQERVSVMNIGGESLSSEEEFDIANMVVTLHEIPPDVRPKVVAKAYDVLKPGGTLQILDFPYPSKLADFRNPLFEFGILDQFFESAGGVEHLTTQEQVEMLTGVGFKDIQRASIGKGMFEFVTASK